MSEILLLKARRDALVAELDELTRRADYYIITIRNKLDPYADDFTNLQIDEAESTLKSLKKAWIDAKALKSKIAKLNEDLADG